MFEKLLNSEVDMDPFPHIIINNFFDENTYKEIDRKFPTGKKIQSFTMAVEEYIAKELMKGAKIEEMVEYIAGLNERNANEFVENYKEAVKKGVPELTQNTAISLQFNTLEAINGLSVFKKIKKEWELAKKESLKKFRQFLPDYIKNDDVLFGKLVKLSYSRGDIRVNTRVTMPNTTALGAHIDSQQEVVAGLIYCRADEDRGQGGDLALYKLKDEIGDKFMSIKRRVPETYVEEIKKIKYDKNVAIFFPNSIKAIHAVTARDINDTERRLINVSIELPGDITLWERKEGVCDELSKDISLGAYAWRQIIEKK